jgi:hypothetical protein
MKDRVGDPVLVAVRLVHRNQDAGEFPVPRIHADRGGDRIRLHRDFPVALDLAREGRREIRVERDVEIFGDGKAGLVRRALARIERNARLDLGATERIGDDLVAAAQQPVAVSFVLTPEVE